MSGGINVPVLVVGQQVEMTISAQSYDRALDLAGYPRAGVARPRNQARQCQPRRSPPRRSSRRPKRGQRPAVPTLLADRQLQPEGARRGRS